MLAASSDFFLDVPPEAGSDQSTSARWTVSRQWGAVPSSADGRLIWTGEDDELVIHCMGADDGTATFTLHYRRLAWFQLSFATREIAIIAELRTAKSTVDHLLVDQIWPRIIAHAGQLVVHASAVETDQGAILFAGPSGRGKSTLAASLHQRGYPLLGDDAIVIRSDGCMAVYPSLRLFPDSIRTLFASSPDQTEVTQFSAKRNIHLAGEGPTGRVAHAIRAIFFLEADDTRQSPMVAPIRPSDACMMFVEHSFWLDPTSIEQSAQRMRAASAVAGAAPAFRLHYARDYSALGELHDAMFAVLA
jgi:hypothetical protein